MAGNYNFSLSCRVSDEFAGPFGGSNVASAEISYKRSGDVDANPYAGTHALTAGETTITLSTLDALGGGSLALTGSIIRGITVENLGAASMTFAPGATNPFPIPNLQVPGLSVATIFSPVAGGFGTVATGTNTIDVTGTAAQSFKIMLLTDEAPA